MNVKILAFIYNDKKKKFLALRSNPHPKHGKGGWFVVTGGVENGESHEDAVGREVKEETNLDAHKILDLNWGSKYKWNKEVYEERNFLVFIDSDNDLKLDMEEVVEYQWLGLEEFVKLIMWDDDRTTLRKVLKLALKGKYHFRENNKLSK